MKRQCVFVFVLMWVIGTQVASASAAETFPEPTGFGKAKFGMSAKEVGKLYPKMQPTEGTKAAVAKGEDVMAVYELQGQHVGPLNPCRAEFRFFKDELYEVQFRCPDRVKVVEWLQKTYGVPTKTTENAAFWIGKHGAVSLAPRTGAFAYGDAKRSQAMQAWLWAYMQQQAQASTPKAAQPTPAAQATPPVPSSTPPAADTQAHE